MTSSDVIIYYTTVGSQPVQSDTLFEYFQDLFKKCILTGPHTLFLPYLKYQLVCNV